MNNYILWLSMRAEMKFRITSTNLGVMAGAVHGIQAICTRLHMTIRKPNGGVTVGLGFLCSIANHLQMNIVQYNVSTRNNITASKFHGLQSVGSSGNIPVYNLTDLHRRCLQKQI